MKYAITSIVLSAAILLNGCATILGQFRDQGIDITSKPSGASVTVDSEYYGVTPLTVTLDRRHDHFLVITSGTERYEKKLGSGVNFWIFGNVLFGGLIGLVVDTVDGASCALYPFSVNADFEVEETEPNREATVKKSKEQEESDRHWAEFEKSVYSPK